MPEGWRWVRLLSGVVLWGRGGRPWWSPRAVRKSLTMSVTACVSAADPERHAMMLDEMGVSLSVTRLAT